MKAIKDLLYDKNDILVALLILCIAALVIATRVNAIMTYPERMVSAQSSVGGYTYSSVPEDPDYGAAVPGDDEGSLGTHSDEDITEPPADEQPEAYSLHIAYGESMAAIARNLVALGFFESEQDFVATLEAHNAAAKVQAGDFVLPADATKDEVVKIITGVSQ
jgi:hypothetical protein